jgi:hypothetical protein
MLPFILTPDCERARIPRLEKIFLRGRIGHKRDSVIPMEERTEQISGMKIDDIATSWSTATARH